MGGRSEVTDMTIIDALESLLLLRDEEERKFNARRLEQYVDFESMLIAAAHVNGGSDDGVQEMRDNHIKRLTTKVGRAGAAEAQKEMNEMQWPEKEVQAIATQESN